MTKQSVYVTSPALKFEHLRINFYFRVLLPSCSRNLRHDDVISGSFMHGLSSADTRSVRHAGGTRSSAMARRLSALRGMWGNYRRVGYLLRLLRCAVLQTRFLPKVRVRQISECCWNTASLRDFMGMKNDSRPVVDER